MKKAKETTDEYEVDINFGNWLKAARKERGISLSDVASSTGISFMRLQSLESGQAVKGITLSEIKLLAAEYRIEPSVIEKEAIGSYH